MLIVWRWHQFNWWLQDEQLQVKAFWAFFRSFPAPGGLVRDHLSYQGAGGLGRQRAVALGMAGLVKGCGVRIAELIESTWRSSSDRD